MVLLQSEIGKMWRKVPSLSNHHSKVLYVPERCIGRTYQVISKSSSLISPEAPRLNQIRPFEALILTTDTNQDNLELILMEL